MPRIMLGIPPPHLLNPYVTDHIIAAAAAACINMAPNPNHSDIPIHKLVQDYYSNKPNFGQHIGKSAQPSKENEPSKTSPDELQQGIESLQVDKDKNPTLEEQKEYFFKYGGIAKARKANMPVHPAEENVSGSM